MNAKTPLAVLLALVSLSSCDAVLETFYPEFKNQAQDQGDVGIQVEIGLGSDLVTEYQTNGTDAYPVVQRLVPFYSSGYGDLYADTTQVQDRQMEAQQLYPGVQNVWFDGLYNATWAVLTFVDENQNGLADYDEPSALAEDPQTGEQKVDMRYRLRRAYLAAELHRWSRAEGWLLDQLNDYGGGSPGSHSTPPNVVLDPSSTVTTTVGTQEVYDGSRSYAPDGYLDSYDWWVTDTSDNLVDGPWNTDDGLFTYEFPSTGTYRLHLAVTDNWYNFAQDYWTVTVN